MTAIVEIFLIFTVLNIFLYTLGTRFRPLSLELPKPLFPVAGFPVIHHHIEACSQVSMFEIAILWNSKNQDT